MKLKMYNLGPLTDGQKELVEEALQHLRDYFSSDSELETHADDVDNLPDFTEVSGEPMTIDEFLMKWFPELLTEADDG